MDPRPREALTVGMRSYQQQARLICRAFMAQTEEGEGASISDRR